MFQGYKQVDLSVKNDAVRIIREVHATKPPHWLASEDGLKLLECVSMEILINEGIDDVRFLVEEVRALDYLNPNEEFPVMGLLNKDHEVALYMSQYVPMDKIESRLVEGMTPLENAVQNHHRDAALYLMEHKGARMTDLVLREAANDPTMAPLIQDPVE
jgi:hypothetical protein